MFQKVLFCESLSIVSSLIPRSNIAKWRLACAGGMCLSVLVPYSDFALKQLSVDFLPRAK
jgi:hypothetical protein